jgi:uncharacterized protein (UPF0332 family)
MDSKRVAEAKKQFDTFLQDELLVKETCNAEILKRFEENALESLVSANALFSENISLLWTVVTSYYAMFYIASAYVYKRGYKAQHQIVHKVITEALIVLCRKELTTSLLDAYEEEKDKALSIADTLLDSFEFERSKRASFQYEMGVEVKKAKAQTSLDRASMFVETFRELLYA